MEFMAYKDNSMLLFISNILKKPEQCYSTENTEVACNGIPVADMPCTSTK